MHFYYKGIISSMFALLAVLLFNRQKIILTCALLLILGVLYYSDKTKNPFFYLFAGLGGALAELIIINLSNNTWTYKSPDIMGIPFWLIPLWAIAAAGILSIYELTNILYQYLLSVS